MSCSPKLALVVLAVLFSGQVQAQMPTVDILEPQARDIATDDPCAADLGVASPSDNLSCEFVAPGGTFCYSRSQLCNGNPICLTGSDEGTNIAALDCKFCNEYNFIIMISWLHTPCQVLDFELGQILQFLSALLERMFYWTSCVMVLPTVVLEMTKLLHFVRVSDNSNNRVNLQSQGS